MSDGQMHELTVLQSVTLMTIEDVETNVRRNQLSGQEAEFEMIATDFVFYLNEASRTHSCKLCGRWFGFTYASSQGHHSDAKTEFAKRQRSRNRKPSYLLCTTCGDFPMLCHFCFRVMHIDEDPFVVQTTEAARVEYKRREEEERGIGDKASSMTPSRCSSTTVRSPAHIHSSSIHEASFPPVPEGPSVSSPRSSPPPESLAVVQSTPRLLGPTAAENNDVDGDPTSNAAPAAGPQAPPPPLQDVSVNKGPRTAITAPQPQRQQSGQERGSLKKSTASNLSHLQQGQNGAGHIAIELYTLNPQEALAVAEEAMTWGAVNFDDFFAVKDTAAGMEGVDAGTQLAVGFVLQREANRRQEILDCWEAERFASDDTMSASLISALRQQWGALIAPITQYMSPLLSEPIDPGVEPAADDAAEGGGNNRDGAPEVTGPQCGAPLILVGDASRSGAQYIIDEGVGEVQDEDITGEGGNGAVALYVDRFYLEFLVATSALVEAEVSRSEADERQNLIEVPMTREIHKTRGLEIAHSTVNALIVRSASTAWLNEVTLTMTLSFESEWLASLNEHFQVEIDDGVTRHLDGRELLESGALDDEEDDEEDGLKPTVRWMRFFLHESIERRKMWDLQLEEWMPQWHSANIRKNTIQNYLTTKAFLQQYNFHANQTLRSFFSAHVAAVVSKLTEYLEIMGEKADNKADLLFLQRNHAVSRQEFADEERELRNLFKAEYAASRLTAREAAVRRQQLADGWTFWVRELPNEERFKRFSLERLFVLEYRELIKGFWKSTRMDVATLIKACPPAFEFALSDWRRRTLAREQQFGYQRPTREGEAGSTPNKRYGAPLVDCFEWPPDTIRQLSYFWCPKFGPSKKRLVNVPQGTASRALRGAQPLGGSKGARQRSTTNVALRSTVAAISAVNHLADEAQHQQQAVPMVGRLIDDGPQPVPSALSLLSSLLDAPCYTGKVRFSHISLVEDVVCWSRVCLQGQDVLRTYSEASAFDDLWKAYEDSVIGDFERKWSDLMVQRERDRLAKLETQIIHHRPQQRVKEATPLPSALSHKKKKKRRTFSDNASSVMSAGDETVATSSGGGDSSGTEVSSKAEMAPSSEITVIDGVPIVIRDDRGRSVTQRDLPLAELPNYSMRESFFGSRFLFGKTQRNFKQQWVPRSDLVLEHFGTLHEGAHVLNIPDDVGDAWGRVQPAHQSTAFNDFTVESGGADTTDLHLFDATLPTDQRHPGVAGLREEWEEEEEEIGSDFGDGDRIVASRGIPGAYRQPTAAFKQRQTEKYDAVVQREREAQRERDARVAAQKEIFWKKSRAKLEEEKRRLEDEEKKANSTMPSGERKKATGAVSRTPGASSSSKGKLPADHNGRPTVTSMNASLLKSTRHTVAPSPMSFLDDAVVDHHQTSLRTQPSPHSTQKTSHAPKKKSTHSGKQQAQVVLLDAFDMLDD